MLLCCRTALLPYQSRVLFALLFAVELPLSSRLEAFFAWKLTSESLAGRVICDLKRRLHFQGHLEVIVSEYSMLCV